MVSSDTILQVQDVSKSFGGLTAVNHCSLAVRRGTITGLIGPDGGGKTTLFNLLSGFYQPDQGSIWLNGQRIEGLPPPRVYSRGIYRTFQVTRELRSMKVLENLMLVPGGQ